MLDWDASARRIGVPVQPTIAELHRAHVTSIPFENLDPHGGVPVSLEPADLERKLVSERRGGYCFEQNLLLKAALERIGAQVEPMLARVRLGAPPGVVRPRSHLVLAVHAEGARWHADVGFGNGTLLAPIPFGPGDIHDQSGWQFRIVSDGPELVLQAAEGGQWRDLYGFIPDPGPHDHDTRCPRSDPDTARRAFRPTRVQTRRSRPGRSDGRPIGPAIAAIACGYGPGNS